MFNPYNILSLDCRFLTCTNRALGSIAIYSSLHTFKSRKRAGQSSSRKLLRIKVTPDLHLTYSKNGGNLGLVLKMKNIGCISILSTKHVKYTYLYLFKLVLYSIVAFKAK